MWQTSLTYRRQPDFRAALMGSAVAARMIPAISRNYRRMAACRVGYTETSPARQAAAARSRYCHAMPGFRRGYMATSLARRRTSLFPLSLRAQALGLITSRRPRNDRRQRALSMDTCWRKKVMMGYYASVMSTNQSCKSGRAGMRERCGSFY